MKKILGSIMLLIAALAASWAPDAVIAGPDLYCGDTKIYGGTSTGVEPNVLIFVDTSASMASNVPAGAGGTLYSGLTTTYDPVYSCVNSVGVDGTPCQKLTVYEGSTYNFVNVDVNNITTSTSCDGTLNPRATLISTGKYTG
ncbi:MAG TPA: hypothetical protein VK654_03155, partial [Nitrospirota bacterium]|nr:hypothetical protein [Nitrospirota bacterium]